MRSRVFFLWLVLGLICFIPRYGLSQVIKLPPWVLGTEDAYYSGKKDLKKKLESYFLQRAECAAEYYKNTLIKEGALENSDTLIAVSHNRDIHVSYFHCKGLESYLIHYLSPCHRGFESKGALVDSTEFFIADGIYSFGLMWQKKRLIIKKSDSKHDTILLENHQSTMFEPYSDLFTYHYESDGTLILSVQHEGVPTFNFLLESDSRWTTDYPSYQTQKFQHYLPLWGTSGFGIQTSVKFQSLWSARPILCYPSAIAENPYQSGRELTEGSSLSRNDGLWYMADGGNQMRAYFALSSDLLFVEKLQAILDHLSSIGVSNAGYYKPW